MPREGGKKGKGRTAVVPLPLRRRLVAAEFLWLDDEKKSREVRQFPDGF